MKEKLLTKVSKVREWADDKEPAKACRFVL
jgi:hypothetical protein